MPKPSGSFSTESLSLWVVTRKIGTWKKLISTHGIINEITTHKTYRIVAGEWKTINYTDPISRNNYSKHLVGDVNARRYYPIGLEDVWHTKWWPHQKFTFLCSVSEVNALNYWVRARRLPAESQLAFRRKLARCMLHNKLDSEGHFPGSPDRTQKRYSGSPAPAHEIWTRPKFTGAWDLMTNPNTWKTVFWLQL